MHAADSTRRFSDRVEHYVRSRPGYPEGVTEFIAEVAGLGDGATVADIGSGTGLSSELFLKRGDTVFGVEPNAAMRGAAERLLAAYPQFRSVDGTAEATTLAAASVDLVVAGQAFHWFDRIATRREFARIARSPGWTALIWNTRRKSDSPFERGYEALIAEFGTDYAAVRHENIDSDELRGFFDAKTYQTRTFENVQRLDLAGFQGRLLSSSYLPSEGHPRCAAMLAAAERLFVEHALAAGSAAGCAELKYVELKYDCEVHVGCVGTNV